MHIESVRRQPVELLQAAFGTRPETFDAVDVICPVSKLIIRMIDTKMFTIANINQPVIITPAVRMDNGLRLRCARK